MAARPAIAAAMCGTMPRVQPNAATTDIRSPRVRPVATVYTAPVPGETTMMNAVIRNSTLMQDRSFGSLCGRLTHLARSPSPASRTCGTGTGTGTGAGWWRKPPVTGTWTPRPRPRPESRLPGVSRHPAAAEPAAARFPRPGPSPSGRTARRAHARRPGQGVRSPYGDRSDEGHHPFPGARSSWNTACDLCFPHLRTRPHKTIHPPFRELPTPRGSRLMPELNRRRFLQIAGATAGFSALSSSITRAAAIPAARRAGSIKDVEHVVVLMQENRSFDHYFGAMKGVRGFGDPRPATLRQREAGLAPAGRQQGSAALPPGRREPGHAVHRGPQPRLGGRPQGLEQRQVRPVDPRQVGRARWPI